MTKGSRAPARMRWRRGRRTLTGKSSSKHPCTLQNRVCKFNFLRFSKNFASLSPPSSSFLPRRGDGLDTAAAKIDVRNGWPERLGDGFGVARQVGVVLVGRLLDTGHAGVANEPAPLGHAAAAEEVVPRLPPRQHSRWFFCQNPTQGRSVRRRLWQRDDPRLEADAGRYLQSRVRPYRPDGVEA